MNEATARTIEVLGDLLEKVDNGYLPEGTVLRAERQQAAAELHLAALRFLQSVLDRTLE